MSGILYGVGLGPGDPKLLTLKAVEILKKARTVAVPDAGGENTALRIAAEYIEGREILRCPMPMTRDRRALAESRGKSAEIICERLEKGGDVAFITLGDPSVYSTYMYLHRLVRARGYETRMIPGVPSFCAAAAALGVSLCDGGQALHIIPASYADTDALLRQKGNFVLMKSGKELPAVRGALRRAGLYGKARMAERCGMDGERIFDSLDDAPEDASYFSIILVKDEA